MHVVAKGCTYGLVAFVSSGQQTAVQNTYFVYYHHIDIYTFSYCKWKH